MRRRDFFAALGGAAMAWPLTARGQGKSRPVIGYLSNYGPNDRPNTLASFRSGLEETGFVEGRDVDIEYRWGSGHSEAIPRLVAELVERRVDVLVTSGGDWGNIAKAATKDIPIVANLARDPVTTGLVASLGRPDANLTGVMLFYVQLLPKRLEILHELAPAAKKIAIITDPAYPGVNIGVLTEAVQRFGIELSMLEASSVAQIEQAFAGMAPSPPGALLVFPVPFLASRPATERLIALSAQHHIPAGFSEREQAEAGGLSSYGTSSPGVYKQLGVYAGRILHGEKPGDLPILQPTTFDFVINLKTAKALGLTVPSTLLVRADEVIE